jgi:hypothetical protein
VSQILGGLIGGGLVVALAWLAGFDFDKRGMVACFVGLYTLCGIAMGVCFVRIWEDK